MEIESAVLECSEVAEAAVVGAPDELRGLVPIVFATPRSGHAGTAALEAKIKDQVASSLSKIATPGRVYFCDALPKTPSGKILRRMLKELVTSGEVRSDATSLEDASVVERLKAVIQQRPA
jgi:acetyl-CoA synthetase